MYDDEDGGGACTNFTCTFVPTPDEQLRPAESEKCSANLVIPAVQVPSDVLAKILMFCKYSVESKGVSEAETKQWRARPVEAFNLCSLNTRFAGASLSGVCPRYAAFYKSMDIPMLIQLIINANFMEIKPLLDGASHAVADMVEGAHKKCRAWGDAALTRLACAGKSGREIRDMLNIRDTFTEAEEDEIRRAHAGIFE